jgi:hypothetical protein
MTTDRLKDAALEYLERQQYTVFGEFFDIKDEKRRDEAADFLARHMRGVLNVRHEQMENGEPLPEYKGETVEIDDNPDPRPKRIRYFNRQKVVA